MNRKEVKKLLKKRDSLLKFHSDMDKESNDTINSESTKNIYKNSCNSMRVTIHDIDKELLKYVKESPVGEWLLQIKGITPDLAAGLLAYFNIKNKIRSAQFIKYSGVDNYNNPHNSYVEDIIDKIKDNFKSEPESLYRELFENKFEELIILPDMQISTALLRADRYMRKVFISHLFEEMYREEHDGKLPDRHNDANCVIIEPEVPYTK